MSNRLYDDLAGYYDLIYHWKSYEAEASRLRSILAQEGVPDGADLWEAACGTGSHLQYLRRWYAVRGLDLNEGMLAVARQKLPGVTLERGDMTSVTPSPPVDAIVCLFSSIGYVHGPAALKATFANFARGLRAGGVLVIEPFETSEKFRTGTAVMQTYDGPELKLCRAVVPQREGDIALLRFHWLIAAQGGEGVRHEIEEHRLWLCSTEEMMEAMREAGFEVHLESEGLIRNRGLLVGRHP